jgi:hypothetical protein
MLKIVGFMDSGARSKVAIVLGIVILVADLLWLYGSVSGYGAIVGRSLPYRNFTANTSATHPGYNISNTAFRGRGYSGYVDIAYGLVILVADLFWLYLDLAAARHPAGHPGKKR